MNNKPLLLLALLGGFLLGFLARPWLSPGTPSPPQIETAPAVPALAVIPVVPPPPTESVTGSQSESSLVLQGVFVNADTARSRALIAQGDASARIYKTDDKLPDGSTLKLVTNKSVEVEKNGETQTLALERGKPGATDASLPAEELPPAAVAPAPTPEPTAPAELPAAPEAVSTKEPEASPP